MAMDEHFTGKEFLALEQKWEARAEEIWFPSARYLWHSFHTMDYIHSLGLSQCSAALPPHLSNESLCFPLPWSGCSRLIWLCVH